MPSLSPHVSINQIISYFFNNKHRNSPIKEKNADISSALLV